jgi:CRISPR-associated protein Csd1
MYLQRLAEFADDHPNRFPSPGYRSKKYHWIADIVNNELDFIPAVRGNTENMPDVSRSSGVKPALLTDKVTYVFGFTEPGTIEKRRVRVEKEHQAYLHLLKLCADETVEPLIRQLYSILKHPILNLPDNMKPNDIIIFRDNEETFLHEKDSVKSFWKKYIQPVNDQEAETRCMICGTIGPVMERHTIEFPLGRERTKLISANATAYESHGMKLSAGSPVCYPCEQKYGQALTYLLQRHTNNKQPGGPHMLQVHDLTYVYWLRTKKQMKDLNHLITLSMSNEKEVKELLQSVFSGIKKNNSLHDFCILTLSASKARMVVRGYEESSLVTVQKNIERFFAAQDVNQKQRFGVYQLAATMYTKPSTQMEKYAINIWMEWLLHGRPLSSRVLVPILKQIQAKGVMYPQHGAAIKSWLVSQNKEEWNMANNIQTKQESDAMICGRLFAVLEKLQVKATNPNETIASRFFGSASTTPQAVFGLLIKNSQAHLNSIRKESEPAFNSYSKRVQNILKDLHAFPAVFNLKSQAEFALGYYHERRDLYTKRENKKGVKENGL